MKVRIKKLDRSVQLPQYATAGSVAFDLAISQSARIEPRQTSMLKTGLVIEVPEGHALFLIARSSLAKKGLILRNSVGVIDQDYHGPNDELGLLIYNFTDSTVEVNAGERLAQGVILPIVRAEWEETESLSDTSRGGFGSTG
ncbi:MAG: dUTP diphosphatase [Candidatus Doudnabacteria bacterium]|nr:dUTP diphosphatase [Candidatus Doudnabacteria bacterium]